VEGLAHARVMEALSLARAYSGGAAPAASGGAAGGGPGAADAVISEAQRVAGGASARAASSPHAGARARAVRLQSRAHRRRPLPCAINSR